jgi:hypothetical protein
LAAAGLMLVAAGWLGWQLWRAQGELHAARATASRLTAGLRSGDTAAAQRELSALQRHTGTARHRVSNPVLRSAASLPSVGDDLRAIRVVAEALDDVATGVLPTLVRAGGTLHPVKLRAAGDRFALDPLERTAPALEVAAIRSARIHEAVSAVDTSGLLRPVKDGVHQASAETKRLAEATSAATTAARLIPAMLGEHGPRRYFVAFQNNAEARGTGGLLGAYGVLEADHGRGDPCSAARP